MYIYIYSYDEKKRQKRSWQIQAAAVYNFGGGENQCNLEHLMFPLFPFSFAGLNSPFFFLCQYLN